MRTFSYRVTLRKEPEGGYTVMVPALPGCITYGKTVEEAIEMSKDAITGYVESLIEDGEAVPVEDDLIRVQGDSGGSCLGCRLFLPSRTLALAASSHPTSTLAPSRAISAKNPG